MSKRRRTYAIRGPIWVAAGLIWAAILATGLTVWGFRSDAIEGAANDVNNIATILAEQTARCVDSIHSTLIDLRQHVVALRPTDPADFRDKLATFQTHELLKHRAAQLPAVAIITLADAYGQIVGSSRHWPAKGPHISDRDFFRFLIPHPTQSFYVSEPVASRVTGAPTIFFAYRLEISGDFLGVAIVGVELSYFGHVYESVTSLRSKSFLLVRRDGTILVRYPETEFHSALKMS